MKKLIFLCVCLWTLNLQHLAAADNQSKPKSQELGYNVRFTWWTSPSKKEIYYVTSGRNHIQVNPGVMSFTQPVNYVGESSLILNRKLETKDSKGNPIITYEPVITIDLEKAGSKEVGIILISNPKNGAISHQIFNLSEDEIPYGCFYLVNFSKAKITGTLNASTIKAVPGQRVKSPIFKAQTSIELSVVGENNEGKLIQITNSQIALDSELRFLYFVAEKRIEGVTTYVVKTILDSNPNPKADENKPVDEKNNSGKSTKDKSTKAQ
jgi:hypothetical protein